MRRLVVGLAAAVVGCSADPPVGAVAGTVTLDGKPVAGGSISFVGVSGGVPATAEIGPDGRYRADPVPAGPVRVAVFPPADPGETGEVVKARADGPTPNAGPPPPPRPKVVFPARYSDPSTSGLAVTVRPQGEVAFDVAMTK